MTMSSRNWKNIMLPGLLVLAGFSAPGQDAVTKAPPGWLSRPLSLADAMNLALQQNGAILKGNSDLKAQYGVEMQTRAVVLPKVQASGNYQDTTEVESLSFASPSNTFTIPFGQNQTWNANIQLVQTIY